MRRISGGLGIGIAMAVGILGTLLWMQRDAEPVVAPVSPMPESPTGTSDSGESPAQSELPREVAAPTAESPSAPPLSAPTNDDATYNRMLVATQANANERRAFLDITKWHETFMLTPDDPEWGRATEQSLRSYFQKGYSGNNFAVTSVACRSEGCEVQTVNRIPVFNGLEVVPPASEEFGREMNSVFELTHEPQPLGEGTIRLDNIVATPVDDQMGSMLWYRRVPGSPRPTP